MNSNYYLPRQVELNLLGNWIKGDHRDDLAIFEPTLFTFRNLYRAAAEGDKTFLQLYTSNQSDGVSITEMLAAVDPGGYSVGSLVNASYLDAKATALNVQRARLAEELKQSGADVGAITERLLQTQATIDKREVKPAAANLSANFLKILDGEAAAKKIRYGRGFENLDKKAGSMRRGQLIVLAARPATGKSAAALQIGYNVAEKGNKVLFFPLEMTTQETLERLLLQQQIVDSQTSLKFPTEEDKRQIATFLDEVEEAGHFLIYEGVNNLETITQTIKEQRPDLVILDQLTQIRTAKKTKDIRERYVEITADLKHTAIENDTAILLLTQLNREAVGKGAPSLENLHESDATGQNADVVLLMQRKDPDESKPEFARRDDIAIYVVKNRGGSSNIRIPQVFDGSRFTFNNVSY